LAQQGQALVLMVLVVCTLFDLAFEVLRSLFYEAEAVGFALGFGLLGANFFELPVVYALLFVGYGLYFLYAAFDLLDLLFYGLDLFVEALFLVL
jgi:hypothetical protein